MINILRNRNDREISVISLTQTSFLIKKACVGFPKKADTIEIRQSFPYKLLYFSS